MQKNPVDDSDRGRGNGELQALRILKILVQARVGIPVDKYKFAMI